MSSSRSDLPSLRLSLCAAFLVFGAGAALVRADDGRARRLVEDLRRPYLEERELAKNDLLALGDAALDAALAALIDPDARVRAAAAEILGKIAAASGAGTRCALLAQEALLDAVERKPGQVRMQAIEALLPAGAPARAALERRIALRPANEGLQQARSAFLRIEIERALDALVTSRNQYGFYPGQFDRVVALGPAAVPILLEMFTQPACRLCVSNPQRREILRVQAGWALADMGDPSIVPELRGLLESATGAAELAISPDDLEEMTAWVLHKLGDREPMAALIHRLEQYATADAGRYAVSARLATLQYRTGSYDRAEPIFRQLLNQDPMRRDWARYCLACLCAIQKRIPEALSFLSQSLDAGYPDLEWVKMEGDLRNLQGLPEYEDLIRKAEVRARKG